jgi:hypothetical protein
MKIIKNKKCIIFIIFFLLSITLLFDFFVYKEKLQLNTNFIAITYDNSNTLTNTENLKTLFEKKNYNYIILGKGEKWNGWYGRVKAYSKAINDIYDNNYDNDNYILLCDGRDVLINENFDEFFEKAVKLCKKNNQKIIFGAERHCCAGNSGINNNNYYKDIMKDIAKNKTQYDYYYLNFGLIFGKIDNIKIFLDTIDIKPNDTDQSLAVIEFCNNNNDKYTLDYNQELFSNNSGECKLEWDFNLKKFKHTVTNTFPSILHFPGGNWDCYKKCCEKLYSNFEIEPIFYN